MAKFFGSRSKYLISNIHIYSFKVIGVATFLISCSILLLCLFILRINPSLVLMATIVLAIFSLSINSIANRWVDVFGDFTQGLRGEDKIALTLKTLPDEYSVFSDVQINPEGGNTDFVVIGPTGLFTIEVKSHNGNITYNGSTLIRNGRKLEKDFLHQSMDEAFFLRHYLYEKLNTKIFVQPVLVFSNHARMRFGFKKVESVFVVHKNWLIKLITEEQPPTSFLVDRQLIEEELRALVKEEK